MLFLHSRTQPFQKFDKITKQGLKVTVYESEVDIRVNKRDEFISGYSTNHFNNYLFKRKNWEYKLLLEENRYYL